MRSTSPTRGAISVYAQGKDYHDVLKGKLKQLAALLAGAERRRRQGLRRYRAADGKAARRRRRPRLAGQAHQPRLARARLVAVPRRHPHHRRAPARRAGGRPLRHLPALPRRLPDGGVPGALSARCAPLHRLPDDRAQGTHPGRVSPCHGQPRLRLRRLPRRLPVEQVRRRGARSALSRARRDRQSAARRVARLDDARFPRALCRHAGQAHRARPLRAQRADRRRQLGRHEPCCRASSVARRCLAAGARHGRLGHASAHRDGIGEGATPPPSCARGR